MNFIKQWFSILVSCLFVVFIGLAIFNFKFRLKETVGAVIARDIEKLQQIFERIDQECGIIGFDHQKNPINFLNVKSFSGSEVGSMNLSHPDKWAGPYLADNPVVQNKEYQIVRTQKGYFITPGDGVQLPNGKVVGKDILLDENADIKRMMVDEEVFYYEDESLAAQLRLGDKKGKMDWFDLDDE